MKSVNNDKYLQGIIDGVLAGDKLYNSVFFYGNADRISDVSLKLVHAWQKKNPDKKVIWLSGQEFMVDMIWAIKEGRMEAFKKACIDGELLVFDHAEEIAGKQSTMQLFYGLFDYYYDRGRQIVISATIKPCMMLDLDDRIKTQLEGGIMCRVE